MFLHFAANAPDIDPTMDEGEIEEALGELDAPSPGRTGAYWSRIRATLLEHSSSDDIEQAVKEWKYTRMWSNQSVCELCGHNPIKFHFQIINRLNGNSLVVGSECIYNYLEIQGVPSKEMLKKRLNQLRAKAKAVAKGEASEDDIAKLEALQALERDLNQIVAKIASPEADIDVWEFMKELSGPIHLGKTLNIKSASFQEILSCDSDLQTLFRQLENITKRSTKYKSHLLLPAIATIMGFRSGIEDQRGQLETLRKNITKAFNAADAKGLIQMVWGEVKNSRAAILNHLNTRLESAKNDCQLQYRSILDFVKPYDHLHFLLQAGIDSNKAQMDKSATEARKKIESEDFFESRSPHSMRDLVPSFVSALSTGDSRLEDAAYHTLAFLGNIRGGYATDIVKQDLQARYGNLRDFAGINKVILRAGEDGLINPEKGIQAIKDFGSLVHAGDEKIHALLVEEMIEIRSQHKQQGRQKVFEAMSEQWDFDVKKFFQAVPSEHPFFPGFCDSLLRMFLRGVPEMTYKQRASVEKNSAKYKTPVSKSCWDLYARELTQPYTQTYAR